MPPKRSDAGPSSTRRRKMKEGVGGGDQSLVPAATGGTPPLPLPAGATVRYFPLHHQPPFTSTCPPQTTATSQRVFTLLQCVVQGEHFKCVLAEMQRRQYDAVVHEAEEKAAKKVKEKELELNQVARKILGYEHREALFQKENQLLQSKLKYLEDTNASLRAALQEALLRGGKAEETGGSSEVQQDEAESSHVGRHRLAEEVEPIKLACRACGKRVATVMTWPCRHVSTCTRCDETTKACPVCGSIKTTSVEVRLP
nr:probable BOI-related E3 ubiquitin-protein ligase 3 [Coffea arabica]